ncbi:MAG: hypothetical protein WBW76_10450, partial [Candidatus Cybelea sp.]
EDIGTKRLFELLRRNILGPLLRMLLAGAVDENIEPPKPFNSFLNETSSRALLANISDDKLALPAFVLNETASFVRIIVFLEIGDCDVGAFLCRKNGDGSADATITARDQ